MNLPGWIKKWFTPAKPLSEGLYHKNFGEGKNSNRVHLRMQKNGTGILILNASTVLQLNPSAAEYAFYFIKGEDPTYAAKLISSRYRISRNQALNDYSEFVEKINQLINTTDLDPVSNLGFEPVQLHSAELTAPLRLDCALTYLLPPGTDPIDAPIKRVDRELSTDEWKTILDKAWTAGVPHIIFTGGEATLRADLLELIDHAEKNGQVSGLLTDGIKLVSQDYLETLLNTGLDHLMIILPAQHEPEWQSIKNAVEADIFLTVHLTVFETNINQAPQLLTRLKDTGVENISLSLADRNLMEKFVELRNLVASLGFHLVSDLPVPYSAANPVAFETSEYSQHEGSGKTWLYIEPDGDVLPSQGNPDIILGNLLRDEWEKIYPSHQTPS